MFYVYFLKFKNGSLYIGQTDDLDRRLKEHSQHLGARFVVANGEFGLIYQEVYETRVQAMQREKQLKKWTRAKKEALARGDLSAMKSL